MGCEIMSKLFISGGVVIDPQARRSFCAQVLLEGGRIAAIRDYTVPETQVRHRLVVIEKVKDTPAIYPRSFARIKKAPLK